MGPERSFTSILVTLALFLLLGGPAVFFMWREMSELLYGRVGEVRFELLLPAALLFVGLVVALARWVRRLGPVGGEGSA